MGRRQSRNEQRLRAAERKESDLKEELRMHEEISKIYTAVTGTTVGEDVNLSEWFSKLRLNNSLGHPTAFKGTSNNGNPISDGDKSFIMSLIDGTEGTLSDYGPTDISNVRQQAKVFSPEVAGTIGYGLFKQPFQSLKTGGLAGVMDLYNSTLEESNKEKPNYLESSVGDGTVGGTLESPLGTGATWAALDAIIRKTPWRVVGGPLVTAAGAGYALSQNIHDNDKHGLPTKEFFIKEGGMLPSNAEARYNQMYYNKYGKAPTGEE